VRTILRELQPLPIQDFLPDKDGTAVSHLDLSLKIGHQDVTFHQFTRLVDATMMDRLPFQNIGGKKEIASA